MRIWRIEETDRPEFVHTGTFFHVTHFAALRA